MKKSYDFSGAERGKFSRKDAVIRLPVYLDPKLQGQLERIAKEHGKGLDELVNQLLAHEVKLLKDFQ